MQFCFAEFNIGGIVVSIQTQYVWCRLHLILTAELRPKPGAEIEDILSRAKRSTWLKKLLVFHWGEAFK